MNGVISNEAALEVQSLLDKAVKDYLPHLNTAVEALGVFKNENTLGPIARDYVAFNA